MATFTAAVDRLFASSEGEHEADLIDVVTCNALAETVCNHLGKGRPVAVAGRLQTSIYETKDGSWRQAVEVVAESVQGCPKTRSIRDTIRSLRDDCFCAAHGDSERLAAGFGKA